MQQYFLVGASLPGEIFRAVLAQSDAVPVTDGMERNGIIRNRQRKIRGIQPENVSQVGALHLHIPERADNNRPGFTAGRGGKPPLGVARQIGGGVILHHLFAEFLMRQPDGPLEFVTGGAAGADDAL